MTKTGKIIIGSGLALGLITLIVYISGEVKKLKESCIRLLNVRKINFNNGINLTLILGFKNKSDISMDLKSQQYEVFLNDYHVADIKSSLDVEVKSHDSTAIPVDISIDTATVLQAGLKNLGTLLTKELRDKMVIQLKGSVSAKSGVLNVKDIPVDLKWTIKELSEPIKEGDSKC